MTKAFAFVTALSLLAVFAMAPVAHARRGGHDDGPRPQECEVKKGGVRICK